MKNYKKLTLSLLYYGLGLLFLIWPALYNGFPLLYSDSGTYLNSSIDLVPPNDRPIFYGYFLRITAMQAVLWIPIIVQGVLSFWIIHLTVKRILTRHTRIITLSFALILSILTGIPWYTSQLMPDLFTALMILLCYLYLTSLNDKKWLQILFVLLSIFFTGMHLSNTLILAIILAPLFIKEVWLLIKKKENKLSRIIVLYLTIPIVFLIQASINYSEHGSFKISRNTNLFLAAKCLESPLLKTYMKDNPNHIKLPYADQIDSLPDSPMGFLWDGNSPINTSGLNHLQNDSLFEPVMKDLFSISYYRNWFIKEAFRSSMEQIRFHKVGSGLIPYGENSAPYFVISKHYESELKPYLNARQQTQKGGIENTYHDSISEPIYHWSFYITLLGLLFVKVRKSLGYLIVIILLGIYSNALITAGLANIYDRLQVRVNWLITFSALICLVVITQELLSNRKNKKSIRSLFLK